MMTVSFEQFQHVEKPHRACILIRRDHAGFNDEYVADGRAMRFEFGFGGILAV